MNVNATAFAQPTRFATDRQHIGQEPAAGHLEIDESMRNLMDLTDGLTQAVGVLLRRLEPVTGDLQAEFLLPTEAVPKVPLAHNIDVAAARVAGALNEVERAVRALQL